MNFVECPRKIVAIVVKRIVGVLARVESAVPLIREDLVAPADDALRRFAKKIIARNLIRVKVIAQEFGIVVGHFFEVRNEPALIHGVAMEAAGELAVDAAAGHFFERGFGNGEQMFVFFGSGWTAADSLLLALEDEINDRGVRKFR